MNYKKTDRTDYEALLEIIKDSERVLVDSQIKEEYSHDELGGTEAYPEIVCVINSTEEVSAIMK